MAAETQRFAKQLVAEIASVEELATHISVLKLECSRFKADFEKFRQHNTNDKAVFRGNDSTVGSAEYVNQQLGTVRLRYEQFNMLDKEYKYNEWDNVLSNVNFEKTVDAESLFLHDSEVNWLQNMFLLEDKIKVMKEMASRNKEKDLGLIVDLEALECLTLSLKYGSKKFARSLNMGQTAISDHNELADLGEGLPAMFPSLHEPSEAAGFHRFDGLVLDNNLVQAKGLLPVVDLKQYDGHGLFHCSTMLNSTSIEPDTNTFVEMKGKISELSKELEVSKVESNNLAKKMNQMECFYETLIRELEGSQQLMHAELQAIKDEHRSCLYTIATLENQAQEMHNDKDDLQARFFAEKHALDFLHEELEKRAVTAETGLKRLRKSYCIATDHLLKDLETLSYQVLSMYETNEEVARQSFTAATQYCLQESKETFPSKVKLRPRNLLLKEQCETKENGACPDAFLMDKSEKCLLQENTVAVKLTDNIELKGGHGAQSLDARLNHLSEAQELQRTCKGSYHEMLYLQEDREVDSDHSNTLNMGNTSLLALLGQLDDDQAFHTSQADLITKQLKVLASSNSMNCQKDETSISSSFTMPVLESQPCDKSDGLNGQAENKELKGKLSELDLLFTEANHLLLLQRDLPESSENKLTDTESVNFYLEIFSLVLMETLQRSQTEIVAMLGKQKELIQQLEHSTKLKELLIIKLQDSSKRVKLLQENEVKNSVRHDELVMKNNSLETMLEDLLKEKRICVEKLKEREMKVTDLVIYKEKYASCTVEFEELKSSLEEGKREKVRHENEITLLKENLRTLRQELAQESSTRFDKEKTVALLQYSLENLRRKVCALHETIASKTAVTDVPEKLDRKDLEEDIFDLEQLHHEAQQKLLQFFEEKKETEEQLKHAESQIVVMKEKTETEAEILKLKLEESTEKSEKLQAELVDMTDKHMLLAEAAEKYAEEKRKLSSELAALKVEMQSICEEKDSLAKKVMGLESSGQELEKIKVALYDSISENKTLRVSLHSAKEESIKQIEEVVCLKGTLRILEDELQNVAESKDKLEAELANSTSRLNEKQYMNLKRHSQLELLIEEGKVSLSLAGKLLAKAEDELSEIQMLNLYLEIFSLVLQETLKRAHVENMTLNKKKEELDGHLEHFIELEKQLTFRLQAALENVKILQEDEARSKVICEDLILKKMVHEKTLQDLLEEKNQFSEKLRECEMMAMESVGYREKYEACIAEKKEVQRLHEKGKLQMVMLDSEVASLKESLRTLTIDLGRESSERDEQDRVVASMQKRLQELRSTMLLFSKSSLFEANSLDLSRKLDNEDIQTTIAHVQELQREITEKFLLCCQEKNEIEEELDFAQRSLRCAESEVLFVKEKSEMDMKLLMEKLDESNSKLEQLSAELVDVTSKFKIASLMEETHAKENMKLSSELSDLKIVLQSVKEENINLLKNLDSCNEINLLKENLRTLKLELERKFYERDEQDKLVASIQGKLHELRMEMLSFGESGPFGITNILGELDSKDIETTISHVEELQHKALEKFLLYCQEKKAIQEEREIAQRSLEYAESQVLFLTEKSEMDVKILMEKLDESSAKLSQLSAELIDMTIKFEILSETVEMQVQESMKLFEFSNVIVLESVQEDNRNLLKNLANSNDALNHNKRIIHEYMSENKNLTTSLQSVRDESAQQMKELGCLKENFRCLQEEVYLLRISKDELESALALITYELNEKHEQLVSFTEQKIEFLHLKQQVLDLSAENSKLGSLLLDFEEHKRKLIEDMRCAEAEVRDFENDMDTVQKLLLAADVDVLFLKNQVPSKMGKLYYQISVLQYHILELQTKLQETPMTLDAGMASEAQYVEESARTLEPPSVELEVDAVTRWGGDLKVGNIDFQHLNVIVLCLEEELEILKASSDELDITNMILFCKLDELNNHIICLDGYGDELNKLRAQNSELTQRLSEQVLKTEEFRNLSIHLQELKDRTDTTHSNVTKAADEPSFATQESLRIAFIREQCETKLQELRSQLYLSRNHSEELLLKLQIALDELEARKKSEAAYARKIEDLSMRVHELEAELQSVINDMREKAKGYNQLKTELEVSMLSLMCSKEEKENLEISLQECQHERMKLCVELTATKEELENHIECQHQQGLTVGGFLEKQRCKSVNCSDLSTMDPLNSSEKDEVDVLRWEKLETNPAPLNLGYCPGSMLDKQSCQGIIEPMGSLTEDLRFMLKHNGNQVEDDRRHMQCVNRDIKEKSLFSSMERLQKELERMKNENLAPLLDQMEHHSGLACEELFQREMSQLKMVNEQLRNVFPQFNEFLESGNALERVLALEIELAEALQSKKNNTRHFQSSFLKQHNDEEAIFKSFRDINELIKDMVELKRKNLTLEIELKEMHKRYSQLSVQFAEVEGERQKLVMTFKNIRSPRKHHVDMDKGKHHVFQHIQ